MDAILPRATAAPTAPKPTFAEILAALRRAAACVLHRLPAGCPDTTQAFLQFPFP